MSSGLIIRRSQVRILAGPLFPENIQHAPDFSSELAIFSVGLLPGPGLAVIRRDPNFAGAGCDSAVSRIGKFDVRDVANQRRPGRGRKHARPVGSGIGRMVKRRRWTTRPNFASVGCDRPEYRIQLRLALIALVRILGGSCPL